MPSFSERYGYVTSKQIQIESIDTDLCNSIWNFIENSFLHSHEQLFSEDDSIFNLASMISDSFHKKLIHMIPYEIRDFVHKEFQWFEKAEWNRKYDYCEFLLGQLPIHGHVTEEIFSDFNYVLERGKAGYRLIGGHITPIIDKEQIEGINAALATRQNLEQQPNM